MQGLWLLAFVVQWVLVLILAILVVGILRYLHSVQERWNLAVPSISKYELQQQIDGFELPNVAGMTIRSKDVLQPSGAVILFVTTRCSSCITILAQITELTARSSSRLGKTIVVIVAGGTKENLRDLLKASPTLENQQIVLLSDENSILIQAFGIRSVPTGLEVDYEGRIIHQTFNPHTEHWLYKVIEATPPEKPVTQGHVGIIIPAALENR